MNVKNLCLGLVVASCVLTVSLTFAQEEETVSSPLAQQPFASVQELFDKVDVADVIQLRDGRLFMAFSPGSQGAYSTDGGRTWDEPFAMKDEAGNSVTGRALGSLMELKSGALGFYTMGGYKFQFHVSHDGGRTWSVPIDMLPEGEHAYGAAPDRGIVTQSGRIVVPVAWYMTGPRSPNPKYPLGPDVEETLCYSFALYSDDEGQTWQKSYNVIFTVLEGKYPGEEMMPARGKGGFYNFEEPTVVELSNGDLMMFGRSILGRTFKSISVTDPMPWPSHHGTATFDTSKLGVGAIWRQPVPTPLASARAPSELKYIPALKAILCIWNQVSVNEILAGISRHRLSTALSFDDGVTWQHFKNLESLDDVSYVEPPPIPLLHGVYGHHYNQPEDRVRYHRAPGSVRTCYPQCRVLKDTVIIQYNYGGSNPEDPQQHVINKRRVLPISWFTED